MLVYEFNSKYSLFLEALSHACHFIFLYYDTKQQHIIKFFSCTDLKSFKTLTRDNGRCYIREPIASQDFDS